jgi:Ycf66 protein N-terminus.
MLAYILALAVGLGSFSIYMAAFFFPEVHRKSDFVWSGVGLFYALILWACAGRITGALLLGQMAGVALLGWLAWETLSLRRQVTPIAQQTPIPELALLDNTMKAVAGGSLPGWFGQKKDTAPTKPKFVRSQKPKTEVVPPPVPDRSEVKVEEEPTTPPVAEFISESSIAPTPEIAHAAEFPIPDSIAPTTEPIPVWSIETPVADTTPAPVESALPHETPLPLEISEIVAGAPVEPTEAHPEAHPEAKVQQQLDEFDDEIAAELTAPGRESQAAVSPSAVSPSAVSPSAVSPTAVSPTPASPTPAKVPKKSAGFGSLFDNIKNSLGGFLGRGADKSKSAATQGTLTPILRKAQDAIEPVAEIPTISAPDIDQILESELASAAVEVAAETRSTAVEESPGVPLESDIERAVLMSTASASSPEIGDRAIAPSETGTQTSPETQVAEDTEASDVPFAKVPSSSLEKTVVEVVSVTAVKIHESGDAIDSSPKLEVEAISIEVISIEPTGDELSQNAEKPELSSPNPPDSDLVETATPAVESQSEHISSQQPPTA